MRHYALLGRLEVLLCLVARRRFLAAAAGLSAGISRIPRFLSGTTAVSDTTPLAGVSPNKREV